MERGEKERWRKRKGQRECFKPQRCNSLRFLFSFFSALDSSRALASNSAATESLSCPRLISHFHLLKAINTHRDTERWETRNNKERLSGINSTTALALFSLAHTALEAEWDRWWSYGLSRMHGMTDVNRDWGMKDTDRVSQGKGILQQRADLKDSSRLKLIEIPFVAFGVFHVVSLSLCQCPQSLNKQIGLPS